MRVPAQVLLLSCIALTATCLVGCGSRNATFDSRSWIEGDRMERGVLLRDLLDVPRSDDWIDLKDNLLTEDSILCGMDTAQVLVLLGEPDRQQVFDDNTTELIYEFYDPKEAYHNPPDQAPYSPYGYPPVLFILWFDQSGVLNDVRVTYG